MADPATTPTCGPTIDVVGLLGGRPVGAAAEVALSRATLVVGSDDQLTSVDDLLAPDSVRVPLGPGLRGLDAVDAPPAGARPCVLASGDPGLFGIVGALGRRVGADHLRVHPAPSSVSLAFARIGRPWQHARIVSAHARPLADVVADVLVAPLAAVLVDPDQPPQAVGAALVAAGASPRRVWVGTRLGEDGEAVTATDLDGLAAGTFDHRSVVVLEAVAGSVPCAPASEPIRHPGWGRDIEAFVHRDGMITKPEVRAAVLGRLDLPASGVLWDLGAGSGSVAIEAALAAPGLRVIAVERRADDAERIRANAARLGAAVAVVVADALDVVTTLPAPDRVFVGGGGLDVLDAARSRVAPDGVVVATFAAADRAVGAHARLGRLAQIAVSQAEVLPDGGVRFVADNPVFVAWGPGAATAGTAPTSTLVVGVGCSTDATVDDVTAAVDAALDRIGRTREDVAVLATVDRRLDHPAVVGVAAALDRPLRSFTEADLDAVAVPNPSPVVASHLDTASVAEAAALLAAGPDAALLLPKTRAARVTVAIAAPAGGLVVVGLGPGGAADRTAAATEALAAATVVHGYGPYVDQCEAVLRPDQRRVRWGMGEEAARARGAVLDARSGERVVVVSSGDAGIFSMASVTLEVAAELAPGLDVRVVPGVTAATAAAALVGAPLAGDHASISLSDRLRPWEQIAARVDAAASTDFSLALYNPRSRARPWQLGAALDLVRTHRDPSTPVAVVAAAGRAGESVTATTLGELDPGTVGMDAVVLVGSSDTVVLGGRLVTRRHHPRPDDGAGDEGANP